MATEETKLEDLIQAVVSELLLKMGFSCEIEIIKEYDLEQDKENIVCNIKTDESNFLIGQYGINLQSLQHIARILIRRKTEERTNFIVDVNSYRKEKNSSIILIAKNIAEQVVREQKVIALRPMSPYERRLVHMELSKNIAVVTESVGEGEERKIIIKPASIN
ncbi:MAG: R3H domain-containing nucleic acid-binding protein [Parcubacteria group bacterium]|jgi:spoIIIJ-associated protein